MWVGEGDRGQAKKLSLSLPKDFILAKARRFYLSNGDPLGVKGLKAISVNPFPSMSDEHQVPTSVFFKLTERAVFEQTHAHMTNHSLYPLLQSAYRFGHSTETALLKVHNDLLMNMDAQRVTLLVL